MRCMIHICRVTSVPSPTPQVGGNGRRMSHNPPQPVALDIYDRLGVVVMNEVSVRAIYYHISIIISVCVCVTLSSPPHTRTRNPPHNR